VQISLQDKIVFITGGTGTLGRIFSRLALRDGAKVFFTYFQNKTEADALEKEGARGFAFDSSGENGIEKIKDEIKNAAGRIDILVNNAGATANGKIGTLSGSDWDKVIDVNLSSVFRVTRAFLPLLYRSEKGRILNVASRLGVRGGAGASNYAAAKAGLMAFTRSLAMEVGRKGILVNALNPGFMISGMTKDVPEEIKQRHIKESVLGVHGNPEEIAHFMMYILSDHCRSVSGQIFNYDSRIL